MVASFNSASSVMAWYPKIELARLPTSTPHAASRAGARQRGDWLVRISMRCAAYAPG